MGVTLPPRKYPIRRSAVKKKPRSAKDYARIYGSKARVKFVQSLPCAACGVEGYSVNAHLTPKGEKGTGYKGDYRFIAPLCDDRMDVTGYRALRITFGCHKLFDRERWKFDAAFPDFNPEIAAQQTEQKWQEHLKETA